MKTFNNLKFKNLANLQETFGNLKNFSKYKKVGKNCLFVIVLPEHEHSLSAHLPSPVQSVLLWHSHLS